MLSDDQILLQQKILDLVDAGEGILLVNSPGGTGKTYTAVQTAIAVLKADDTARVVLSAPTHVAKEELASKIPAEVGDDIRQRIEVVTCARLFGCYLSEDIRTGAVNLYSNGSPMILRKWALIIIDEISAVSWSRMSSKMLEWRNILSPVVALGDPAQLPPVQETVSPLFKIADEVIELTQQHRNEGPIEQCAKQARFNVYYPTESIGDSVVVHKSSEVFIQSMVNFVNPDNAADCSYLAYTNAAVAEMSSQLRMKLYGTQGNWVPGEFIRLAGGSIIRVETAVDTVIHDIRAQIINGLFTIVCNDDLERYQSRLSYYQEEGDRNYAIGNKDRAMFLWGRRSELTRTFMPCTSGLALTVNKAQGRSIPYVWVDTPEISRSSFKANRLYVAYSRASKQLNTVAMAPPPRFRTRKEIKHAIYNVSGHDVYSLRRELNLQLPAVSTSDLLKLLEIAENAFAQSSTQ